MRASVGMSNEAMAFSCSPIIFVISALRSYEFICFRPSHYIAMSFAHQCPLAQEILLQ